MTEERNNRLSRLTANLLVWLLMFAVSTAPAQSVPKVPSAAAPVNRGDLPQLSTVQEIRALSLSERKQGYPVEVEGRVTISLRTRNLIVIQNGDVGLTAFLTQNTRAVQTGQKVRLRGFTMAQRHVQVLASDLEILDSAVKLPAAKKVTVEEILANPQPARLVEVSGFVRSSSSRSGRQELVLRDRNHTILVQLFRLPRVEPPKRVIYSKIRFTGVIGFGPADETGIEPPVLLVRNWNSASVLKATPSKPFQRKLKPIADVLDIKPTRVYEDRVHVRGEVTRLGEGNNFFLRDNTGEISVSLSGTQRVKPGEVLDVMAYTEPDKAGTGIQLEFGRLRRLELPGTKLNDAGELLPNLTLADYVPALVQVENIRKLSASDLKSCPPVRIRGNAVYHDVEKKLLYVQDGTAGVAVLGITNGALVQPGALWEVSGFAVASETAPVIKRASFTRSGAEDVATPVAATTAGMAIGRYDGEWVSFDGIGRRVEALGEETLLIVARSERSHTVRIRNADAKAVEKFVNADIVIKGVARTMVDSSGQNRGSELLVADLRDIEVEESAPEEPFGIPAISIGALKRFRVDASYTKRNLTTGVVTLAWPNRVFLEDGTNTLEVLVVRPTGLVAGDRAEVLGFPRLTPRGMILEDAIVRARGPREELQAKPVAAQTVLAEGRQGQLVSLEGTLLKQVTASPEQLLIVQQDGEPFPVVIPEMFLTPSIKQLLDGSRIRATGILSLESGERGAPHSFRLLLPDSDSVMLLTPPPWWTPARLSLALAALVAAIALMLLRLDYVHRRARQSETRFAQAIDSSPVAIGIVATKSGRIIEVNDRFLNLLGFTRTKTLGKTMAQLDFWTDSPPMENLQKSANTAGSGGHLESTWRNQSGEIRHVMVSTQNIELDQEACLLLSAVDVTEKFQLLDQLRDSQKLEAVGKLAAGVSHDFNNLLTVIQGNTEILKEELQGQSELSELNDEVDAATRRAAELTRQLLAFSRKQMLQMRAVNTNELVANTQRMLQRLLPENISLETSLPETARLVHADAGMLEQVIINLAVNARDAMPRGGVLTVSVDSTDVAAPPTDIHPEAPAGHYVRLRVSDNGCGMDEVTRTRIFEPFFTTKDVGKGTGLGLATVYGIVRQHRGWIDVESRENEGSTFRVFLPILGDAEPSATAEPTESDPLPRGSERVLLVEDEASVRRVARGALTRSGYEVTDAANAGEALRIWADRKEEFDLLLTDVMMPGGVDGVELARRLTDGRADLKVLFISGYTGKIVSDPDIRRLGGHLLPKPFAQAELARKIRDVLDGVADAQPA